MWRIIKYVPTLSEFEDSIMKRQFPCGWFQTKAEKTYAAYLKGSNPGVSTKGYKIAHIHSAGKEFNERSPFATIADLCNQYFPRGIDSEWDNKKTDVYGSYHYRQLEISDDKASDIRAFLVAHFMRMVHPINYFLVPNKKNRYDKATKILKTNILWDDNGAEKDEIGEDPDLIKYVSHKMRVASTIFMGILSGATAIVMLPVKIAKDCLLRTKNRPCFGIVMKI